MTKTVHEMSATELKELRDGLDPKEVTPQQLNALNDLIVEKQVEEAFEAKMAKRDSQQKAREWDKKAYSRWPALKDKESQFYKMVEESVKERGDGDVNPRALWDAANEVGQDLGYVPEGFKPAEGSGMARIKPGGAAHDGAPDNDADPELDGLLDYLAGEGYLKNDDETKERIAARREAKTDD